MKKKFIVLIFMASMNAYSLDSELNTFSPNTKAIASEVNENFENLEQRLESLESRSNLLVLTSTGSWHCSMNGGAENDMSFLRDGDYVERDGEIFGTADTWQQLGKNEFSIEANNNLIRQFSIEYVSPWNIKLISSVPDASIFDCRHSY
ncbi:Uncharacterised protein [BD1-7 clade bacterium]|uniref:Uncharacterized protein n=1 Tax=BD1-7 clade bacterium TaxID=2029982 RepID=A0A5S9QZN1_9GAMM|nr:Uncharacterised protein [BD1-7 clade bacterium]